MRKGLIIGIAVIILVSFIAGYFMFYGMNYKSHLFCSSEIRTLINKYDINKRQIAGCQSESFSIDGKEIKFIHLEYGDANDCPSGCFFSHYCAIVEDGIDYPYVFSATSSEENILIPGEWGEITNESILTGKTHPLAEIQEFKDFLMDERKTNGEFRWCGW